MKRLLLAVAACGPVATPALENRAARVPHVEDRAYVADETGLVEVGPTMAVIATDPVRWCSVDARANVVWLVTTQGLAAFDLADRMMHPVIRGDLTALDATGVQVGELAVIIDWGNEQLGGENKIAFDVGVTIAMATQRLSPAAGCFGDRGVYCYDEHGAPTYAVAALERRVGELELADPSYVASLAKRGARRALWAPTPAATKPMPPTLDRTRCNAMPEQCGELTAVPGQGLWLVVTDNGRGDYFHESRALWDPARHEFLNLAGGKLARTRSEPEGGGDFGGMRVSPAGMSIDGVVFDASHVIYAPVGGGHTCGWASGGWRIPGPTDG